MTDVNKFKGSCYVPIRKSYQIFFTLPKGYSHVNRLGMLIGKVEINPYSTCRPIWAQLELIHPTPERCYFKTDKFPFFILWVHPKIHLDNENNSTLSSTPQVTPKFGTYPLKVVRYEIQKPSACLATLFYCKFWTMFHVFHLAWSTCHATKMFVAGWRKLLWKIECGSTLKTILSLLVFHKLTTWNTTNLLMLCHKLKVFVSHISLP